jgi:rRNA maturation RNase YbeY
MGVEARSSSANGRSYLRALRHDAMAALEVLDLAHSELSLLVCDDPTIQRLNRDFRHQDKPTDVLSFPQVSAKEQAARHGRAACSSANHAGSMVGRAKPRAMSEASLFPPLLGDVVISLPTARRQARALGLSPRARLRTLMIHGLLHLLGYDHERSATEARRMFAREREIAAALDARAEESRGRGRRRRAVPAPLLAAGTARSRNR